MKVAHPLWPLKLAASSSPVGSRCAVHFSSRSEEWPTPQWFFDLLNDEFHFTLDPCATPENAKCVRYFTKGEDGLCMD